MTSVSTTRFDKRGRCLRTGKRAYRTKIHAMVANARKPIIARAYRCAFCGSWHLTRKIQG